VFDAVNHHGRNKPGVVGRFSANGMCCNEAAPFRIDGTRIRESENRRLDAGQHSLGLSWSEAESIVATGRVQTAQSSIRFCDVTQGDGPPSRA
jgi:hypothetical protein